MSLTPPAASRALLRAVLLAVLLSLLAPLAVTTPADASTRTPVMGRELVSAAQLTEWFRAHEPSGSSARATVPVSELARLFIEEGRVEGVAGDVAFVQAVLETGWFRWPSGQVEPSYNNFAGIGACDGGTCTVARFPTARMGVRAQIHHLRAYADPTVTVDRLANPVASPRFHLVNPKGMAPYWEQFGGGVWATDPLYASKILRLYESVLRHSGLTGRFLDVSLRHTHAEAIESIAERGVTEGCLDGRRFCPDTVVNREQVATFLARAFELPVGDVDGFADVTGVHAQSVGSLAAAGITQGCAPGRFCPKDGLTRAQMASLLARTRDLPAGTRTFSDVPSRHTHAAAISAIADAGITVGCGRDRFCPEQIVTRAQMAAFLDRALD